jgi:hypothetical protein
LTKLKANPTRRRSPVVRADKIWGCPDIELGNVARADQLASVLVEPEIIGRSSRQAYIVAPMSGDYCLGRLNDALHASVSVIEQLYSVTCLLYEFRIAEWQGRIDSCEVPPSFVDDER